MGASSRAADAKVPDESAPTAFTCGEGNLALSPERSDIGVQLEAALWSLLQGRLANGMLKFSCLCIFSSSFFSLKQQ
ncbi:hypothetical protein QE369_002043 [Agrobacterium larrymoorei]|uniref:Uncharacterized protein n=1 Tax=Agrobacterium larrymoorei TaxID=160699 RepID=A0AAJ2ER85_9HYPH|nr:hypothetical protein [Agrobacterium larrymoorei]